MTWGEVNLVDNLHFQHSNFLGFFETRHFTRADKYDSVYFALSLGRFRMRTQYLVHMFFYSTGRIFWLRKFPIDTQGMILRERKPFIKLHESIWNGVIDVSETNMFIFSDDDQGPTIKLTSWHKIDDAFTCCK